MHTKLCLENLNGRDHTENLCIDGKILEYGEKMWSGYMWLRIGTSGGSLLTGHN